MVDDEAQTLGLEVLRTETLDSVWRQVALVYLLLRIPLITELKSYAFG